MTEATECDFCGYETETKAYATPPASRWNAPHMNLCLVCANTPAGNALAYPEQFRDRDLMRLVAWGINHTAAAEARGKLS